MSAERKIRRCLGVRACQCGGPLDQHVSWACARRSMEMLPVIRTAVPWVAAPLFAAVCSQLRPAKLKMGKQTNILWLIFDIKMDAFGPKCAPGAVKVLQHHVTASPGAEAASRGQHARVGVGTLPLPRGRAQSRCTWPRSLL